MVNCLFKTLCIDSKGFRVGLHFRGVFVFKGVFGLRSSFYASSFYGSSFSILPFALHVTSPISLLKALAKQRHRNSLAEHRLL